MTRKKQIEKGYPSILLSNYLDTALFYFVEGIKKVRPTFKVNSAVELFAEHMRFEIDKFTIENGQTTYYRMLEKYRESYDSLQ